MIEDVLKKELIYKLDFLDLNILKEVVDEAMGKSEAIMIMN